MTAILDKARERMLQHLMDGNVGVALLRVKLQESAIVNYATLDDLPANSVVAKSASLGNKSVKGGVFKAAPAKFSQVSGECQSLCIFSKGGKLESYHDDIPGLPFTAKAQDVTIEWEPGTNKIFKL